MGSIPMMALGKFVAVGSLATLLMWFLKGTMGSIPSLSAMKNNIHIRWMIRRDMEEVMDIENHSFKSPWSHDEFIQCLRKRNCIGMTVLQLPSTYVSPEHNEDEYNIVGHMVYELHSDRLHILNFAVAPDFRRRGIGQQMVKKLIGKLSNKRRNQILLEVCETNMSAQLFFRNLEFRAISILRGFYTTEDAYLMRYQLNVTPFVPINRITMMKEGI